MRKHDEKLKRFLKKNWICLAEILVWMGVGISFIVISNKLPCDWHTDQVLLMIAFLLCIIIIKMSLNNLEGVK